MFFWPPFTNYLFLYSTLLCKKLACAPGGHKKFMLTKRGGGGRNRIDPKISPLKVLDLLRPYSDLYYGKTLFVSPITRQTFPFANEIDCTDTFNNNSCYQFMPAPVPFKPPAVFALNKLVIFKKNPRFWFSLCRNLHCKPVERFLGNNFAQICFKFGFENNFLDSASKLTRRQWSTRYLSHRRSK